MSACSITTLLLLASTFGGPLGVTPIPGAVRERYDLDPFYRQYTDARGIPVVSSERAAPEALAEARYLIDRVLDDLPQIRRMLVRHDYCFIVMAHSEMLTELPHFSHFSPKGKWDYTVRGVFSTFVGVASTCGEENLLQYRGALRANESVLIHELGHAIHAVLPESYDRRVQTAYEAALARSLWKGTYAATDHREYWAEGFQCWYDANSQNDHQHNHVNTREELAEYDPALASLIESRVGEPKWRFTPPRSTAEGRNHLAQFKRASAPRFAFSKETLERYSAFQADEIQFTTQLTLALGGDQAAQLEVARALRDGRGIDQSDSQAVTWFEKAARKAHATAQAELGWMYAQGRGVRSDAEKARRLFQKSARQDDALGQYRLGQVWRDGQGGESDATQALMWLRLSAAQGHERAGVEFARLARTAEPSELRAAQKLVTQRQPR